MLTESMTISAASEHVTGMALVGLELKPGQIPGGLEPGSRVRIVHTPEASSNRQGQILVESALVESINARESSGGGKVTVLVNSRLSPDVAMYASRDEIAVSEHLPRHGPVG
ncbi:hypothetical protein [Nonomuraea insulae]|uniref:SAF domain-containing protein n=1 Tax=Nonomuraea insulae TaxID=1616787 RepID=A0ABW1CSC4_9ACTN